jgi:hypothetical protein
MPHAPIQLPLRPINGRKTVRFAQKAGKTLVAASVAPVSHDGSGWADKEFAKPEDFIDNDVLGYMHAKKETISRRGILEISRAVSTTPWPGTISAHFASAGSNPSVASDNPGL